MNVLRSGRHYGARSRMGPMMWMGMRMRGMMGPEWTRATTAARRAGIRRVAGGSRGRVTIRRLAHLRARAQIAVTALHLARGQRATGRFEAGGRGSCSLIQIRVIHYCFR